MMESILGKRTLKKLLRELDLNNLNVMSSSFELFLLSQASITNETFDYETVCKLVAIANEAKNLVDN